MKKKDLKAALLASALGGAAFVAPVMAEEVTQDPVDVNDQTTQTVTADESTVNNQTTQTVTADENSVKDGWSDGYYYENGQKVVSQFKTIDGKTYYFDWNGNLYTSGTYYIDSDLYYFDADGVMQTNFEYDYYYFGEDGKAVHDQWVQFGSKWRYYDGNTFLHTYFYEMDGNSYAFGDDGYALTGWQNLYGSWYYLNEKGMCLTNQWVDGNNYYVDSDGRMVTNSWIDSENYVGQDGKKTVNSWELVDGKWKYKLGNGTYVTSRMVLIEGKYYAFDYEGYMCTNALTDISNSTNGEYHYGTVHAGSDGVLLKGWYTDEYSDTFYFGDDYFAYNNGVYTIDGKQYYFSSDRLVVSSTFVYDGKLYVSDKNGVATMQDTSNQTKWLQIGDQWYYIKNGTVLTNTIEEINGSYYYFGQDSSMYKSLTFNYNGNMYYANSEGVVEMNKKNTWAKTDDGDTIYYKEDGTLVYNRCYTIDNKIYKFSYQGYLEKGVVNVDYRGYYLTDESGVIDTTAGWKEYKYHWYYAKEDGVLYSSEWLVQGGKQYYFNYRGDMVFNSLLRMGNKLYYFNTNGELIDSVDSFTGIKEFHGKTYLNKDGDYNYTGEYGGRYFSNGVLQQDIIIDNKYYIDFNGKIAKGWIKTDYSYYYADPTTGVLALNEWRTIDGKLYYFDYARMATGYVWTPDGYYHFDENGTVINKVEPNSWYKDPETGLWQYVNEKGKLNYNSTIEVGGKTYYFVGFGKGSSIAWFGLAQNFAVYDTSTQTMRWTNSEGTGFDTTEGWKKSMFGDIAYVKNGQLVKGLQVIDGKTYYFDYRGYLYKGIVNYKGKAYVFDDDGNVVDYKEGWNTFGDELFYIKNGEALMDTIVDGRYVTSNGLTLTGGYAGTGEGNVFFVHGEVAKNQWIQQYGAYYYADENGHMVKNQWVGNSYVDEYGRMVKNTWVGNYYVGADGVYNPNGSQETKAEWKQTNGKWWYQHKDGTHTQNDFETIAGQRYYFDANGYMVTGWQKINGEDYYFNASGIMAMNTWVGAYYLDADGTMLTNAFTPDGFYCGKDGAYLTNQKVTVSGKDYYLNAAGTLAKNQWSGDYYVDSNNNPFKDTWSGSYYLGSDGKYVKNQFTPDGYYCGADGVYVTNRWIVVDGKDYYMNASGKMTKDAWQGAYYLGSDGAMLTNAFTPDGYYCGANGAYLTSQWFKHGGKDYYVNGSGLVVKNAWVGSYYLGSDGVMATSSWVDNNQYYVNENGVYVAGRWVQYGNRWCYYAGNVYAKDITLNINGTAYTFDSEGYMVE